MARLARRSSVRARGLFACLLVCITVASLLSIAAWGQSQAINGTIRGRVVDPSGAAIPEAAINVTNGSTGFSRSGSTGPEGYYVFPNLPLGTYDVTVQKTGFASIKHLRSGARGRQRRGDRCAIDGRPGGDRD